MYVYIQKIDYIYIYVYICIISITSSPTPAGPKGARTVPPTAAPTVEETAEVS